MYRAEGLLPLMSERAREDYMQTMRTDFGDLLRNAVRAQSKKPLAAAQALTQVVRYQGVLLSSVTRQRELAALSADTTLRTLLTRRNATLRMRNRLIMGGRGRLDLKRYRALLSTSDATLDQASEANLRRVHRPLLLHLYTHGFYLPDHAIKHQSLETLFAAGTLAPALPTLLADPMRRSGVALAGANVGLRDARSAAIKTGGKGAVALLEAGDDGILTAEEASTLDLTHTELVVLGACETGVGETRLGQGVYGLRRGLLYAGARSLVVSLWKVPEKQTRELLWAFYTALAKGNTKRAALSEARAAVRKTSPLAYYWAGFVLIGDPGKIR